MTDAFEAQVKALNEARAKAKDPVTPDDLAGRARRPRADLLLDPAVHKWAELESLMTNRDVLVKAFGEREASA